MGIGKKIVGGAAKVVREAAMGDAPECGVFNTHKGKRCKNKRRRGQMTCGTEVCETYNAVDQGWI